MKDLEFEYSAREKYCLDWLLMSDILNQKYFAYHHSYNAKKKNYKLLYTEATGYAIQLFINSFKWTKNNFFLGNAQKFAMFIHSSKIPIKNNQSAFSFGYHPHINLWDSKSYSFDTGICISSLLDLNMQIKIPILVEDVLQCGNWLIQSAQNKDGSFKACFETNSNKFLNLDTWFSDRGCLHAKIAISLYKLYEYTKEMSFLNGFYSVLDWVLSTQKPDGAIPAREGAPFFFTHAHCYALEGLVFAYYKTEEDRFLSAFKKGADWLIKIQCTDGGFQDFYNLPRLVFWRRTDATAQACRIFLILYLLENDKKYVLPIKRAASFLLNNQIVNSKDLQVNGGFYSSRLIFIKWPELNPWSAMFANHVFHVLGSLNSYTFPQIINELF